MLTLIKNANVYAPERIGVNDILLNDDRIVYFAPNIVLGAVPHSTIDAGGKIVTPGFIDQHVHITGGGGQQGFGSLVPEVTMSELVKCGTTTVLGMLGTDGFAKELTTLYAKTKALCDDGITAYMLTSFYGLPEKTLMGSVASDMIFIDKVIGCKLAMSDDRCSFPSKQDVLRLINQVRLGGFTSGKVGMLHIHTGALPQGIEMLLEIAQEIPSFVPYISPTHLIRTQQLFEQAICFAKMGGMVDFSTGGTKHDTPHSCVMRALAAGVDINNITFSSDGHGGVKRVDPVTGQVTYTPAPMHMNYGEVKILVQEEKLPLEKALKLITSNPARNLKLKNKGVIANGADADLCFLDPSTLQLTDVIAQGKVAMSSCEVVKKGRYES